MKIKTLTSMFFIICFLSLVSAATQGRIVYTTPSSNNVLYLNGSDINLTNLGDVNAPAPGDQEVLTWDDGASEWIAQALTTFSKWIVNQVPEYLYNDSDTIYFNETKLNATIDARAGAGNASWNQSKADELYVPYSGASSNTDLGIYNLSSGTINFTDGIGSTTIDGRGYIIASDGETGFFNDDETRWIAFDVSGNAWENNIITCYNGSTGICQFIDDILVENITVKGNNSADWFKGNFNWTSGDDYTIFNGSILIINETKLNNSIDLKSSGNASFNQTLTDTLYAPNTTLGIQSLINSTAILFNHIFSLNWSNVSITQSQITDLTNFTNETINTYNETWSSTYNATYAANIDTQKNTTGFYLYNDSATIYFNDTLLNITIDSRDTNDSSVIFNSNASWLSTYNATYDSGSNASWNQTKADSLYAPNTTIGIQALVNNSINKTDYWDNLGDINATQMENSGGTLNILVSWLTSLFYTKSQVDSNFSLYTPLTSLWDADFNTTFDDRDQTGADGNASSICSGNDTYLSGEGSCNNITKLYADAQWGYNMTTPAETHADENNNSLAVWVTSNYAPNTTLGMQSLINGTNTNVTLTDLNQNINASQYNVTSVDCVIFKSGGKICSGT